MHPVKIFHTADIHCSRDTQEKAFQSLDCLIDRAEEEKPDLVAIAGDLFERPMNNTTSSGLPGLQDRIERILNICPIVGVKGTGSHDLPGCYEIFKKIKAKHNFTMLEPMVPYFLSSMKHIEGDVWSKDNPVSEGEARLLILGLPEPQKTWFMRDKQLGKAESDEAINQGMRELLLGLGALRSQYTGIPCLCVAHIEIANTPTCTGHIIQGGIKIGKDDLALVGADYYALGHIHLAQQIGNMPAFYSGPAFPVNWGETDQKSFNIVEFGPPDYEGNLRIKVDRIPFPHPPRKKIVVDYGLSNDPESVEGFQIWKVYRIKKADAGKLDTDRALSALLSNGALPGSKVEIVTIPTETVRCEGITEATNLRDKVKLYAELSGDSISDSILEKADGLEIAAGVKGIVSEGLHIRLQKLILRGAIGIRKGLSKDQVEIDLESYDPGLIAMVGVNGSGKSTLIENMHPYNRMLTRTGKLQDHFCLRDSFRDLYFIDERTGIKYRSFMQIDGKNESGSIDYFLYQQRDGADWTPTVEEINGRETPYKNEVQKLFGSLSLFVKSAFVSQSPPKNLPEINEATKGEKKAIFGELLGLDLPKACSEMANEEVKKLNDELLGIRSKLEFYDEFKSNIETANSKVKTLEADKVSLLHELEELGIKKRGLEEKSEDLWKLVDKNKELRSEIDNVIEQINKARAEKANIDVENSEYKEALEGKEAVEKAVKEYEDLKAEEGKLNEEKANHEGARSRSLADYNKAREAVEERERDLLDKKSKAEKTTQAVELERRDVLADANKLNEELISLKDAKCPILDMECPAKEHESFRSRVVKGKAEIKVLQEKIFNFDKDLIQKKKAIEAIKDEITALDWPEKPETEEYDDSELNVVITTLTDYNIDSLKADLTRAQEAEVRIEELTKRLDLITEQEADLIKRKEGLHEKIDTVCEGEYEEVCKQLESIREAYASKDKEIAGIQAEIKTLQEQLLDLQKKLSELDDLKKDAVNKEKDCAEWEYLQRACGPDGIQALELDAMGPGIADIANSILESAYGSRFQIEFKTTRIGGKGSQKKQIEDFQIWINDSQDGSEQVLETLSGGESVWVKRAIYDAFGIIRARKTGTKFLTVFQDEADGALDPEARGNYFKMLERAHQESGRHHTIVITHDLEAQEMIGQKIDMNELKKASVEEVVPWS